MLRNILVQTPIFWKLRIKVSRLPKVTQPLINIIKATDLYITISNCKLENDVNFYF